MREDISLQYSTALEKKPKKNSERNVFSVNAQLSAPLKASEKI